jgi:L-lactate dehydrogenase complex protein LldG
VRDLGEQFARELAAVSGSPHPGEDAATVALGLLEPASLVAADGDPSLDDLVAALEQEGHEVLRPTDVAFRDRLPVAAVGITRCTAAIADTGTLLLVFDAMRPRSTSLVPRVHVAVVHEDDLVASLPDAFARMPSPPPSGMTFVTGPSRSADIEQLLTLGVHGPAEVHVILPA